MERVRERKHGRYLSEIMVERESEFVQSGADRKALERMPAS